MAVEADEDYLRQLAVLHSYYILVKEQLLEHQSATIGLYPSNPGNTKRAHIAHVRDSIYCAVATWSLALAYRKIDNDHGRTYELEQSSVKCMRGILYCYLRQADKLEKFKYSQCEENALDCRYDMVRGDTLPDSYHHLQIDIVSLYLLYLVQMISSGLQIIWTLDEVSFVQNLVFYVERAYRIPDYGMWERGSKYNTGKCELNASSIGMAIAALEASNGFNLFGREGTSWSILYVDPDAHGRNRTILQSLLPRESSSKNTDASLIPAISFPAFAIKDEALRNRTFEKIIRKLKGKYGFRRFLRDGYGTLLEDANRKYYKPAEIKMFDNIEAEWPMFFVYMIIDGVAKGNNEQVEEYSTLLEPLMKETPIGKVLPKFYYVERRNIEAERKTPHSQTRIASQEGAESDKIFLWGQSMYLIACMLKEGLVNMSEIDPIGRYHGSSSRTTMKHNTRYSAFESTAKDMTVQMAFIAESARLQATLGMYGIQTQTPTQVEPIQIWPPAELIKAYQFLGNNAKLGLTGRPPRPIGSLGTSKIYRILGRTVLCYPLQFDRADFYMYQDMSLLVDDIKNLVAFMRRSWTMSGRPTICILIKEDHFSGAKGSEMLDMLAMFKRGSCGGIRIKVDRLQTLLASSFVEHLDFQLPEGVATIALFKRLEELNVDHLPLQSRSRHASSPSSAEYETEVFDLKKYECLPSWELVDKLRHMVNMVHQSSVLGLLLEREGLNYLTENGTVEQALTRVYNKAAVKEDWSTVRYCASILHKVIDSLAPSITSMLVAGKIVTIGVFGHEEELVMRPMNPREITGIIFNRCQKYNVREAVMQQEIIIALGKLTVTRPDLFSSMLKIRTGWLLHAMRTELKLTWKETEPIHSLSPHSLKDLLVEVLETTIKSSSTERNWLELRQFNGALNRTPANFYDNVWDIMSRMPNGIIIADYFLPQQPTLSDMTRTDLNFALQIEEMFGRISHPEYRQLMVELLSVMSTILQRNPELEFKKTVNTEALIKEAFDSFKAHQGESCDMKDFYNTPPVAVRGTMSYLAKVIVNSLLDESLDKSEDTCTIC
ncbi:phosphorylase b kinase regulatory subunit beta-like [Asterias amurensis]|uniref:phosphorylase b kinase regulatory subunit beta-like n=1 Tax=Asterias amurensis TaxID=7602 RepID=UPI003AB4B2AB